MREEKPRWVEIGQYRNIPLPVKAIPPPVKHLDYVKYMGVNRKPLYPGETASEKESKSLTRKKRRWA